MNGKKISDLEINKIKELRQTGHSLTEIMKIVERGNSTIFKYAKDIEILPEHRNTLRFKQGGSQARSRLAWEFAKKEAGSFMPKLEKGHLALIAAALYWGEGAKKDFSFTNSDPSMVETFVYCLQSLGIKKEHIKINVRTYEDLQKDEVINFWHRLLQLPKNQVLGVNVLRGKKLGKLKYGMCRVRITKGGRYLKLIQSIIESIKSKVVMPS